MNLMISQGAQSKPRQRQERQPLQVAENPDALLTVQTVTALTGLSTSTLYRKMAASQFVAPVRMGARCTRFRAGDVTAWLRAQAAAAQTNAAA